MTLPHTDLTDCSFMSALKYETPMFQEFITCLFDNSLFPIWVYVNALVFYFLRFFFNFFYDFKYAFNLRNSESE